MSAPGGRPQAADPGSHVPVDNRRRVSYICWRRPKCLRDLFFRRVFNNVLATNTQRRAVDVLLWAFDIARKRWIKPWGTTGLAVYRYVFVMGGGGCPADCVRTGERPTPPARGGALFAIMLFAGGAGDAEGRVRRWCASLLPARPWTCRAPWVARCVARVPEALHVEVQRELRSRRLNPLGATVAPGNRRSQR
jgi:hypothetical protein